LALAWSAPLALAYFFPGFAVTALFGLTLAVLAHPIQRQMQIWLGRAPGAGGDADFRSGLSAVAAETLVLFLLVFCLLGPFWLLYENRSRLLHEGRRAYDQAVEWGKRRALNLGDRLRIQELKDLGKPGEDSLLREQMPAGKSTHGLAPFAFRTFNQTLQMAAHAMVLVLVVYFLLRQGEGIWRAWIAVHPPGFRSFLSFAGARVRQVILATYVCHGLTALAAFVLALPVYRLIAGPSFVLLALAAGIFQLLPMLGSVVLVGGLTAYFFAVNDLRAALLSLALAFPLVVGVPDLVIRPWLARRTGKVPAPTLLVGLIVGIETVGPAGFVLGPLLVDLAVQTSQYFIWPNGRSGMLQNESNY
jgi:predicted PurR-regulated permease PerM